MSHLVLGYESNPNTIHLPSFITQVALQNYEDCKI